MTELWLSIAWVAIAGGVLALLVLRHRALVELAGHRRVPGAWPTVTIVIPARDEENNIEECLRGLLAQRYPAGLCDIRVVDDGSRDHTAEIVRRLAGEHERLALVQAGELPEGWRGKTHACWVGASGAATDWLCFMDADTRQTPALLMAAVAEAVISGVDLLSLHPCQVMLGFWERLLMPVPFMTLMILMDAGAINDPQQKNAMANGQFILIRRKAYEVSGGHEAVRGEVLDDVRLAQTVKGAGFRLRLLGGGAAIHTRMYRDLRGVWQGLARSGSELFGIPLTLLAILNSFAAAIFPLLFPIWLGLRVASGSVPLPVLLLACLGTLLWYGAHALELARHRVPAGYLLLLPLSNILIAIVNLEGVLRRVFARRIWKGRRI